MTGTLKPVLLNFSAERHENLISGSHSLKGLQHLQYEKDDWFVEIMDDLEYIQSTE